MDTRTINETLARLAADQHGIITLDRAGEAGISRQVLHARSRNGSLERLGAGVFRLAGAPPTWASRAIAACWSIAPDAVVSHRAAAMWWGLDGFARAPMEICSQLWHRRTTPAGLVVHESKNLPALDRTRHDSVPITTVVRTLIDVAGVAPKFRVEQAWEDALRKNLCTVPQIANRFVPLAKRGRRGIKVARELLEARTGAYVPTGSVFELRMCELIKANGLPAPVRQFRVRLVDGSVYLDLAWPDRLLAIECDGMWDHATNVALPWDAKRQNDLQLLGWLILRFTWKQLMEEPDRVIAQIAAAHAARSDR